MGNNYIGLLNGYKVFEVPPLKIEIKRTWKERLFSKPWEPWIKVKYRYEDIIKPGQVLKTHDSIFMNRKMIDHLKKELDK